MAAELMRRGWKIIPSYDYTGEEEKAPRLQGLEISFVVPDLDCCRDGRRLWVEVKTKEAATYTYLTRRLEHGFNLRHYHHYCEVRRESGCPVWVCVYEENTRLALMEDLAALEQQARLYRGDRMGRGGMFFFPRDVLRLFATLDPTG